MVTPDPLEQTRPYTLSVSNDEAGERLDAFLVSHFPQYSRVRLRQLIQTSAVRVDSRTRKPAYRLCSGQQVVVDLPPPERQGTQPEQIPLDIVYEDEGVVAINKPVGMVVHPARGHWSGTLTAALAYHFDQLSQVGGSSRPGIVHRLDRDTSGIMVVTKTDDVHQGLALQFEKRQVHKEYFAISHGAWDRDRDEIEAPIGVHPHHRERMAVRAGHPTSRTASTYIEVQRRFRGFLSLRVVPKTGRTHQIRVHLSHIGCPIVCDPLYTGHRVLTRGDLLGRGPDDDAVLDRLALHAHRLVLRHPRSGALLELEAPIPTSLTHLLDLLETHRRV